MGWCGHLQRLETADPWGSLSPLQGWALFKRTGVAAVGNRRSLGFALAPTRMGAFQAHWGGSGWKLPVLGVEWSRDVVGKWSAIGPAFDLKSHLRVLRVLA
jgi:hypothetical protein